jgi:serine/threonine protein kinase
MADDFQEPLSDEDLDRRVEELTGNGEHFKAAALLENAGRYQDAGILFEKLMAFDEALNAFEKGSAVKDALRVALRTGDDQALERLVSQALRTGIVEYLLIQLEREKRFDLIGKVHRACGEMESAAKGFEKAEMYFDAGQARAELGDLRRAGVLYEQHLALHPKDANALYHLGRILVSFAQYEQGIQFLQRAIRLHDSPDMMSQICAPALIVSFHEMEYVHAAEDIFLRWRESALPGTVVPESVPEFLQGPQAKLILAPDLLGGADSETSHQPKATGGSANAAGGIINDANEKSPTLFGGRYLLGESATAGAVGQVFQAYDAFLGRSVAVKVFSAQVMDSKLLGDYERDIQAASVLNHFTIPPLYEFNMRHGFAVTGWVDGGSLATRLEAAGDGAWIEPAVKHILDLLSVAHRVGLVHGSLSPRNILFSMEGVRVIGFGEHHLMSIRSTETGGHLSRWPYLAPEQMLGSPAHVAADVYSVGAILFRVLLGRPLPIDASGGQVGPSVFMEDVDSRLGGPWAAFFEKALAPVASDRFGSALEFAAALPEIPDGFSLSQPVASERSPTRSESIEKGARYTLGDLVYKDDSQVKVYEGWDVLLTRPVWIVDVKDESQLDTIQRCANLDVGVQAIYDILPQQRRAVLSRDRENRKADPKELSNIPQSLLRDLAAVAKSLQAIHQIGLGFGDLQPDRWVGPVGPRIRLAPGGLPMQATTEMKKKDWESFEQVLRSAFTLSLEESSSIRQALLEKLAEERWIDPSNTSKIQEANDEHASWESFLTQCCEEVVHGSSTRMAAQLWGKILRGDAS